MRSLRRVVVICSVLGVVWATSAAGQADPTITFSDCSATASPSPVPTVTEPALTPPPSSSSPSPSGSPAPSRTPGPDNCTPKSGSMVFGSQTLGFSVISDGFQPLRNIKLSVNADDDPGAQDAAQPLFNNAYFCNTQPNPRSTILVPWDTVTDTPYNGKYEVVVQVDTWGNPTCGGTGRSGSATRHNIIVDNAPDPVAAPRILATTSSTVTIQWDAATAPDVTRYQVFRAIGTSAKSAPSPDAFHFLGFSTTTTYRDSQVSPGSVYWYAIIVDRRSVWPADHGQISSPMSASSRSVSIALATPPPSFGGGGSADSSIQRYVPLNPILLPPSNSALNAPVPDAPYSAQLPYGNAPEQGGVGASTNNKSNEAGATDPRGPVLPVAVGAFLVSAALALGRMPY